MKTLLAIAVCVVAVCAYDFADREFNDLLEDELLDLAEKREKFLRNRRETDVDDDDERSAAIDHDDDANALHDGEESSHRGGCKKHRKPNCCGKTSLSISLHQHFKNQTLSTQCFDEVNAKLGNITLEEDTDPYSCEKVKRMKKRFYCIHECAAKKLGLANDEGALDFAKVKDLYLSRVNETWQKDLLGQATEACSKIKYDESWKEDADEYKCNTETLQFKHCVWKQIEKNCPEEHQNTDRKCKKIRSKLAAEKLPASAKK